MFEVVFSLKCTSTLVDRDTDYTLNGIPIHYCFLFEQMKLHTGQNMDFVLTRGLIE